MTTRAPDELIERVKREARSTGRSTNEYFVFLMETATDPDLAGTERERVRARLAAAGLLGDPGPRPEGVVRPDGATLAAGQGQAAL